MRIFSRREFPSRISSGSAPPFSLAKADASDLGFFNLSEGKDLAVVNLLGSSAISDIAVASFEESRSVSRLDPSATKMTIAGLARCHLGVTVLTAERIGYLRKPLPEGEIEGADAATEPK